MNQHFPLILGLTTAYFALILSFVVYARLKTTKSLLPGLGEFFLAGKNLSPLVLTFTALGSLFSTFTVLGIPGLVYVHGLGAILFYIGLHSLGVLFFALIAKTLRRQAEGKRIFSPLEIVSAQYNSRFLGLFMAVIITIFLMPYISLQLVGIGAFITAFTDGAVTYTTGVGSMMVVVMLYLFLGGMRAVAYTDFVQIAASLIGMIGGLWFLLTQFDLSVPAVWSRMNDISPAHLTMEGTQGVYTPAFLIAICVVTASIYLQPHILTRAMMAKNDRQINFMVIGIILGFTLTAFLGLFYGLSVYLVYGPDLQPNFVMGHVFQQFGNTNMIGLVLAALMLMGALGAAMSTADSLLISIGQMTTRDMVRPFIQISPKRQVIFSKIIMMLMLIAAFVTGLQPPQFMTDMAIYSAVGSAVMIPTLLCLTWHKRSRLAAFLYIGFGLCTLAITAGYKLQTGHDLLSLHAGALPVLVAFALFFSICGVKRKLA